MDNSRVATAGTERAQDPRQTLWLAQLCLARQAKGRCTARFRGTETIIEICHELGQSEAKGVHPGTQFDYVKASHPALRFADVALPKSQASGDFRLR